MEIIEKPTTYENTKKNLRNNPKHWCITGVAGFIGSNLLETLLKLNQRVTGIDNFVTGHKKNLLDVQNSVTPEQWQNFYFIEGDICNLHSCQQAVEDTDYVLHQAALGSVPRSIENPIDSNASNVDGFINVALAAKDAKVKRFVYASSSAVYGSEENLPKVENKIGAPLSPYAVTKLANELYSSAFSLNYQIEMIGLRYFNIFGPRQDPNGAYAAVIPRWIDAFINNKTIDIFGDGLTSRDFCYIENTIQANLLAATSNNALAHNQVYNVAVSETTSLLGLFEYLQSILINDFPHIKAMTPNFKEFRAGDIKHSLANVNKAEKLLGYTPTHQIYDGLVNTVQWYLKNSSN